MYVRLREQQNNDDNHLCTEEFSTYYVVYSPVYVWENIFGKNRERETKRTLSHETRTKPRQDLKGYKIKIMFRVEETTVFLSPYHCRLRPYVQTGQHHPSQQFPCLRFDWIWSLYRILSSTVC